MIYKYFEKEIAKKQIEIEEEIAQEDAPPVIEKKGKSKKDISPLSAAQ
jgi:hypothetical protein